MSYAEAAGASWEAPRFHQLSEHARLAILYRLTANTFGGWRQAVAVAVGSPSGPMVRACLDELSQALGDPLPTGVKTLVDRLGAELAPPAEELAIPAPLCDKPVFVERWERWLRYRRKIRHDPVSASEAAKLFAKFRRFGVEVAVLAMEEGEDREWRSVFPERIARDRRNGHAHGRGQDRFDLPTLNRQERGRRDERGDRF